MNEERVRVSVDAAGVAEVAMVRTDKMNAIDAAMFQALVDAIDTLRADTAVRAVVLHGEGRAFCAGLDMESFQRMGEGQGTQSLGLAAQMHGPANSFQQVGWGWRQLAIPVIAAVHGVAFGGGLQIALGADIRCVRPDTKLSVMEIKWGLVPDMSGCVFLTELTRADIARDLVFSASDRIEQSRGDPRGQAAAQRRLAGGRGQGAASRGRRAGAPHRQPEPDGSGDGCDAKARAGLPLRAGPQRARRTSTALTVGASLPQALRTKVETAAISASFSSAPKGGMP
jgi:hypothetical protein